MDQNLETKPVGKQRTVLRRQIILTVSLAVVILLLLVAMVVASRLIGVYTLTDTYRDENGVTTTVKYTVKRDPKTGEYALYNKKGVKMETVPDNGFNNYENGGVSFVVYETEVGGNQYRINTSTGEYEQYAAVDFDDGEALGGTPVNTYLLLYPRITQAETDCLEITNSKGKYRIRNEEGESVLSLWLDGEWEACPSIAEINAQAYSSLCVECGYAIAQRKLDLSNPAVPRLENGLVDYSAYGLAEENAPASYTISSGDVSYTVLVGDLSVSGSAYYAKRADRDAVYLLDTSVAAVLEPAESLVTPAAFYPLGETTYPMAKNFYCWKILGYNEEGIPETELVTAFSYQSYEQREYTLFQPTPYVIPSDISFMDGYTINDLGISEVLARLYEMKFFSCKKLMPYDADLKACGLLENAHFVEFSYNLQNAQSDEGIFAYSKIYISQKTYDEELEKEVCYLYSPYYDMIVAVDPYYVNFIEWEQSRWYNPNYYFTELAYVRELHLMLGGREYDFYLDNSATDLSGGLSTDNLKVTCPQIDLNYEESISERTDTGEYKSVTYTGVRNFKRFNSKLFQGVIEGDVNRAQFQAETGMTVEEFVASDTADDKCVAKLRYHLEDYAKDHNSATVDGEKLWTENNRRDIVLRFYEYESSGRKCLMTVEVLKRDENGNLQTDENGEVLTDATRAVGLFYVNASYFSVLAGYLQDLEAKVLIPI